MVMFGVEVIFCVGVVVENGVWVEFYEIVWVGVKVRVGFWFMFWV